ncbi:MAG: PAS domain S-box protein [Desulfobacterales bacterium]|nr:PAS domain S-box protein [Desulfobacterales bacterium]
MRFLRDYLPSTQESLNDISQATQFFIEAEKLIVQDQKAFVKQIIETVNNYRMILHQIGVKHSDKNIFEASRLVFMALKAGNDICLQIENIVEKNGDRVVYENKIADSRFKESLWFLIAYYAVALILSLILAALVGKSITLPVSELRNGAELFRQGHTNFIMKVTGTDELSLLAITFNQMATDLHQNKITLQERAGELERELSERMRAEKELQLYQVKLEELVENRTSELSKAVEQLSTEISERKQAEEILQNTLQRFAASERKVLAMSQAVSDALIMIDGNGKICFWNQAAEKLFGFSTKEAEGLDFHEIATPIELREKSKAGIRKFAETGKGSVFDSTIQTIALNRADQRIPVEVNLSSFQIDHDWFAVGTVRDITERKKAEAELKQYVTDLEKFNRLTISRELKMIELKNEINDLLEILGKGRKYKIVE